MKQWNNETAKQCNSETRIAMHCGSLTRRPIKSCHRPLNPNFMDLVYDRNTPLLVFATKAAKVIKIQSISLKLGIKVHDFPRHLQVNIIIGFQSDLVLSSVCKSFVDCIMMKLKYVLWCWFNILIRRASYHRALSYLINLSASSPLIVASKVCSCCSIV